MQWGLKEAFWHVGMREALMPEYLVLTWQIVRKVKAVSENPWRVPWFFSWTVIIISSGRKVFKVKKQTLKNIKQPAFLQYCSSSHLQPESKKLSNSTETKTKWSKTTIFQCPGHLIQYSLKKKKKNSAVGKTDLNSNNKIYMKVLKCSDYP